MKKLTFSSLFLLTFLLSCNGKKPQETITVKDSLPETPVVEKILQLPDTQYVSVENFEYEITVIDTVHSGEIDTMTSFLENVDGFLTFRGNALRNADFGGKVSGKPDTVVVEWIFTTDADNTDTKFGRWGGGTGWTGQPLYINWPDSMTEKFRNAKNAKLTKDFSNKEIIFGSLASKVYFLNFETGKKSREPLEVRNPIKGTVSLDPLMNGKLYVGHGVPARLPYGQITADLFAHTVKDTKMAENSAWRGWHASDSSPIRAGQFIFRPSENGTIYKYWVQDTVEILHSQMKYRKKGFGGPGMESSMSVYRNYGYTADNHGNIVCINLNNLKPVWIYDNHDDSDATPVIEEEDGIPYIYIGCEMDRQGNAGKSHFAKINGLTGEGVWDYAEDAKKVTTGSKHFDGGYYATALLGRGNCDTLVFVNYVANDSGQNGYFYAFNKKSGKLEYKTKLKCYSWSSPVGFMNEDNEMFVLTGDTRGNVYLFDGKTGEKLFSRAVGVNFESSPVVVGNCAVLGSRGNTIYKLRVE
jgi:hypothetical protein